jgi:hypothetical protein
VTSADIAGTIGYNRMLVFKVGGWGFETPLYTWSGGDITANWGFWEKIMYGRMIFPTTNGTFLVLLTYS